MKVLFISRSTLYTVSGGDTVQMMNTAAALRKKDVEVTIELCNNKNIDYSKYDLVHYFNIIRPADIIYHIDKSKLPFVVSPIYVEYNEMVKDHKQGWKDKILAWVSKDKQEYLKCIARALKNGEPIVSKKYLFLGHKKAINYILKRCLHLLPNSHSEYKRLKADFNLAGAYAVVPNAVNLDIYNISDEDLLKKTENSVLCVARFEPRKNQRNIIKALSDTHYGLSLAGNIAPNHQHYYQQSLQDGGNKVKFHDFVNEEEGARLFRQHKVHILPSWFETTGLSSLEAAACGCNIVISKKGDTEEYFQDNAFYCEPGNIESIKTAVDKAMKAPVNKKLMLQIKEQYNWSVTAEKTFEVYIKITKKEPIHFEQNWHSQQFAG